MFSTRDGRLLAVSRPSFADVVWIDLATGEIVRRQLMDGYRTDHMNVSPDGRRLVVSDSTSQAVHEYVLGGADNPRTGTRLRTFESGRDARTRATTPSTASGSSTPASAGSTRRSTRVSWTRSAT